MKSDWTKGIMRLRLHYEMEKPPLQKGIINGIKAC